VSAANATGGGASFTVRLPARANARDGEPAAPSEVSASP
jgi:hypothetical protein